MQINSVNGGSTIISALQSQQKVGNSNKRMNDGDADDRSGYKGKIHDGDIYDRATGGGTGIAINIKV
jgi:hypothetical protein